MKTLPEQARDLVNREIWDDEDTVAAQVGLIALADALEAAERDRDTMAETLTIAQARGTELLEENRVLRARCARFGV